MPHFKVAFSFLHDKALVKWFCLCIFIHLLLKSSYCFEPYFFTICQSYILHIIYSGRWSHIFLHVRVQWGGWGVSTKLATGVTGLVGTALALLTTMSRSRIGTRAGLLPRVTTAPWIPWTRTAAPRTPTPINWDRNVNNIQYLSFHLGMANKQSPPPPRSRSAHPYSQALSAFLFHLRS